ncbi:MAG: lactoylglutathione lyase [Kordiimonadaceae bacterium]|nr:lactoylglutathione lyase [Kordiimonadaceae bacterium]
MKPAQKPVLKPHRFLHAMIRVDDLDISLAFYLNTLGMRLLRREDYAEGRFTLAFIGYGDEEFGTALELTHNWDASPRAHGTRFGHLALAVKDIYAVTAALEKAGVPVTRAAGPMAFRPEGKDSADVIAFIRDPDGYQIELIERA